jgi:hypothetical protein
LFHSPATLNRPLLLDEKENGVGLRRFMLTEAVRLNEACNQIERLIAVLE